MSGPADEGCGPEMQINAGAEWLSRGGCRDVGGLGRREGMMAPKVLVTDLCADSIALKGIPMYGAASGHGVAVNQLSGFGDDDTFAIVNAEILPLR